MLAVSNEIVQFLRSATNVLLDLIFHLLRLKLKDFQKFDSAATALEEVSALIEGKVTSRLSSLLDTLKDEKKASLAVADPKLGIRLSTPLRGIASNHTRKCHQQASSTIYSTRLRLYNCRLVSRDTKSPSVVDPRPSPIRCFHHAARSVALALETQTQILSRQG